MCAGGGQEQILERLGHVENCLPVLWRSEPGWNFFQLLFWKQLEGGISVAAQEALCWLGAWSAFFLPTTVGQVTCWKRSPSQCIRAVVLLCLGQTFLKVSQNPGGSSRSLIRSRSTRLCRWMSLEVYTDKMPEVPWREKSRPGGRFTVRKSWHWFWDNRDLLMMPS